MSIHWNTEAVKADQAFAAAVKARKAPAPAPSDAAAPDFSVTDCGAIVIVTPLSPEAREWGDENVNVPDWSWYGLGFGVDHRMAGDLIEGIADAGFEVAQ